MTPYTTDSGIWDNHQRGAIGNFLREKIRSGSNLSFVSAYFTIYAYEALREQLDNINHLRFLFGEPQFIQSLDPEKTEKKAFRIENDVLSLSNRLGQKRVAKDCSDWIKDKTEIKSIIKPGFLHGKMYHIDNKGVSEAIIGSSNFTVRGLGLGSSTNNIELNLEVNDNRDRKDLKRWFDEVWNDNTLVEDVRDDVLNYLAQLYQNHSPEFIYFKTLFHIFEEYLSKAERGGLLDERTGFFDSGVWDMLYDFQKDGVKGAINKILTHNGCVIADSVGLGKTFEALAVIKYFELLNERVLVLCPKKLEENWNVFRKNDLCNPLLKDRFAFNVQAHTDLGLDRYETHNWGNYNLVVIDESHNFRNNAPGKRIVNGERRLSRYEYLMKKILQDGVNTRVLLLSATPVNTNLRDLRNQIYLITQNNDQAFTESLNISSIGLSMKNAQTHFTRWADPKKNPERKVSRLLETLDSSFFKLLDEITIARSRRHIEKYYDIEKIGKFPERLKPISLAPDIDTKGFFPTYDELNEQISKYKLSLYNPSSYLLQKHMDQYSVDKGFIQRFNDQETREHSLIGMMRVNFLKRLESSIESFEITIGRTIDKITELENKITHFDQNRDKFMDMSQDLFESLDDEEMAALEERLAIGGKLVFRLEHLDIHRWLKDLRADKKQLIKIHEEAAAINIDRDNKLQELKRLIREKVKAPINKGNRKVIVFSAFSDTASYLYAAIHQWALEELDLFTALVTGTGDNKTTFKPKGFRAQTNYNAILTNFSPRSKYREKMRSMPQEGGIDILIASDCISEGQNLQDCDYLINYDIHWNPVRIIQRFGRIDRLGSINTSIQLVNFWPTPDLNKYINLKDRVEARMALADLAATGEDDLLNTDQIKDLLKEELTYREKQLLRLKDEVLDLEDMEENISLSEFTLDDFRIELMNYLETNKELLKSSPLGLYSIVPPVKELNTNELEETAIQRIAKPGIIFCLRHKQGEASLKQKSVNPLNPYYLLYIRDDGEIRFTFVHAKQILTIFQALCQGQHKPFKHLCDLFDEQTDNGRNMEVYSELLRKSVNAISQGFKKRAIRGMLSDSDAVLPKITEQPKNDNDFDLITWLIIR